MKLTDIFQRLATGPLRQSRIGDAANEGVIDEGNYTTVIPALNAGLVALYTRFLLKRKEIPVVLVAGQTTYTLTAGDLLLVESVVDQLGKPLALNDANCPNSLRTRSLNVLYVPPVVQDKLKVTNLVVSYRAMATPVVIDPYGYFDPTLFEIELPVMYLDALVYFMAWQLLNAGGQRDNFHEGSHYAGLYEAACAELEQGGYELDEGVPNDRLWRNGWV